MDFGLEAVFLTSLFSKDIVLLILDLIIPYPIQARYVPPNKPIIPATVGFERKSLNPFDYPSILEKCKEMIDSAENELMIQIWMEELEGDIEELLLTKEKQNDFNLVTVLYDRKEKYHTELRQIYKHGFEVSKLREMGNRWITVVTDGKEMLHAAVHNFVSAEAIYTKNNNMVFFAREHVKHDAYCLRLIDILTEQIKQQFGEDMEGIRDVFVIP